MITKELIIDLRRNYIRAVRDYSESQADLWRKVPKLALEADGRSGWNDNFSRAYESGMWAIESSVVRGYYAVYVDLSNGRLVDSHSVEKSAFDNDVLRVKLEELDAQELVKYLKARKQEGFLPEVARSSKAGSLKKLETLCNGVFV